MSIIDNSGSLGAKLCCTQCALDNLWNRRFCRGCGHGLTLACAGCQFANGLQDSFCGGCGCELLEHATVYEPPQRTSPPTSTASRQAMPPATDMASRLTALNQKEVQGRGVAPPPTPKAKEEVEKEEDIGQEQIDALFG